MLALANSGEGLLDCVISYEGWQWRMTMVRWHAREQKATELHGTRLMLFNNLHNPLSTTPKTFH
jgi:hypothetical protein